jgi:general secretion pathway protein H
MTATRASCGSNDAGFTLLEMIAATCLMALAAGLIMPRIGASRQTMRLRATTVELASNLKMTRAAALASNADAVLMVDIESRKYAAPGVVKPTQISKDISLRYEAEAVEQVNPSRAGFRFRPDGTASGGRIALQSGANVATISVDWLTGAVTLNVR